MYHKDLTIDGQRVTLDEQPSGMGARFTLRVPNDAPPSLAASLLARAQKWCARTMETIKGSTIRATAHGTNTVEIEALGTNWKQLAVGFPELEEELGAREAVGAGAHQSA